MRIRMIMIAGALVLGLSVGWYVMAQNQAGLPDFAPGQILTAEDLNTIVDQVAHNQAALSGGASGDPLLVDCDAGDSLAQAMQGVSPGRTIRVSGTCSGQVTVTTDRLTLDGQGAAVLDGGRAEGSIRLDFDGVLTVNGARNVTIMGFTIQNGAVDGLVATNGAVVAIRDLTVQDNSGSGMIISDNAAANIADVTAQRNGEFGIQLYGGARVALRGAINVTANNQTIARAGFAVEENSTARLVGATLQVNDNLGAGIAIANNGTLASRLRFGNSNTISANNNADHGFNLFNGGWFQVAGNTTVSAIGNGGSGIWAIGSSGVVNVPSQDGGFGTFLLENNTNGLELDVQGAAFFIGGLTVRNNGTGILASGADTLTVVSIPPNPSNLTGNTTDVDLSFGTRATFNDAPIDTIICDATVLSRGSTVCP